MSDREVRKCQSQIGAKLSLNGAELSAGRRERRMGGCGELLYAHRGGECLFIARMMTASESSSLFSLPLSLSLSRVREGSVTFSRAITQIPNAMIRRNAFLFSAFYLSLSFLNPASASCARPRTRGSKRSASSLVSFVSSPSLSPHFSVERTLCGAITSKLGRTVGHQETANTSAVCAGRRLGSAPFPFPSHTGADAPNGA